MDSAPDLYLMIPPPLYLDGVYDGMNQTVINEVLPNIIPHNIAAPLALQWGSRIHVISIFDALGGIDLTRSINNNDK